MKQVLLFAMLFFFGFLNAQTVKFSEDFETLPLEVTSSGSSNWDRSSMLQASGTYCDSATIVGTVADTTILTTDSFSTTGYSHVILEFMHIAKLSFFDGGYIEVSGDNGATWTRLADDQYYGNGSFGYTGVNKFNATSYLSEWVGTDNLAIPTNSWWRGETFDLSYIIPNAANARVRFVLAGTNNTTYGWLIDDIKIKVANSDLTPPSITMIPPIIKDTLLTTGPFEVRVNVTDSSGVNNVALVYTIGGVNDTIPMTHVVNDEYKGFIPSQSYGTDVCYQVIAFDSLSNYGANPTGNCISYFTKKDPNAPPVFAYDVALDTLMNPQAVFLASVKTGVDVRIANRGDSLLTKATIAYEIDGVSQTSFNWAGSLSLDMISNTFTIDSAIFAPGPHNIKVYAYNPNDSLDQQSSNDTIEMSVYACSDILSGTYTLGGNAADFVDFDNLLNTLKYCGLDGPTVIKVNPGIYETSLLFSDSIIGIDSINTLTIVSATNNRDDVKIQFNRTSQSDYVIKFDNTNHITFKSISVNAIGASSNYYAVVKILNGSNHIVFDDCNIISGFSNSYDNAISIKDAGTESIVIKNSNIQGGYYGIQISGNNSNYILNVEFNNNEISEFYRNGIFASYTTALQIIGNTVTRENKSTSTTLYAINIAKANNFSIINNSVDIEPDHSSVADGIRVEGSGGASNNLAFVANNEIVVRGTTTNYVRGIHLHSSNYINIVYNSISLQSGSSNSSALYFENSPGNNIIKNNSFAAINGGMAFKTYTLLGNNTFDYNNYYTTSLVLIKVGSNTSSVAQGVSGVSALTNGDTNSVITDPMYYSNTDLHSFSPTLNGAGTPITGVTTDFDGDVRDALTPDIGADEFSISSADVGVVSILNPLPVDTQANVVDVKLIIQNFGSSAVTAMDIKYMINNGTAVNYAWTGSIAPASSDTIIVGTVTLPGGTYTLTAFTDLSLDTLHYNDTLSINRYAQPLIDASIESLETPISGCDLSTNEVVQVVIRNFGVGIISNGLTVSYQVGTNAVITENVTDPIGPNDSTIFTFSQGADLSVGYQNSTFIINVKVNHASDINDQNDSAVYSVESRAHRYAPIVSDTVINYGDTITLTAVSNDPIRWFANDSSTTVLANGDFLTPHLFDTTTYYVQAGGTAPPTVTTIGTGTSTWNPMNKSVYGGGGVFGGITRSEIIYKASELLSMGLSAGPIASIAFNTTAAFSAPPSFEISIGHTSANSTTNFFITTPLQTVVSSTFTATPGWNTHTFNTPFIWDGVSNIVVQICTGGSSSAPPVTYTTTSYDSYLCAGGFGMPQVTCNTPMGLSYDRDKRPNTRFTSGGSQMCTSVKVPLVVTVPFPAIDAMVTDITNPTDGCGLVSTPVTIDIVGMGSDTIHGGFTATYKVDNGSYITPETINDTILSGDTLHYTFNTLASLVSGANGTSHTITAKVVVPNDAYAANDTLVSAPILSKYTPTNPVVTDMIVNYSDSALLTASASDSIYWYADSTTTLLAGEGSSFMSNPIYDTTVFYAVSQRTVPASVYTIGTSSITNTPTVGPSPYGAGGQNGYGPMASRTQILITAAELSAQGMIQGPINSVSFYVATFTGTPLKDYTIKMGHTTRTDMDGAYFQTNLTTVYSRLAYTDGLLWNKHVFDNPFYWDGVSNIIVETYFKNTAPVSYARVYHTITTDNSVAYSNGGASYNYADSSAYYNSKSRPNMKFDQMGLGLCVSDAMPLTVTVPSYPQHDAALTEIVEPIGNVSSAVGSPVKVVLKNFGLTSMTSAIINWSEKGIAQTPYTWTGSLMHGDFDTITIEPSHMFKGGITELKAWVALTGDTVDVNDTVTTNVSACMSGAYTINPLSGDYHSFTDAINEMSSVGICGPVVFNVDSGTYGEQLIIYPITGSSATNTITFQSTQMDSSKVTITGSTLLNNNYIFKIDGASNIIIQNLSLTATGSQYGNVIVLETGAHDIVIKNNRIMGATYYGYSPHASGVYTSVQGVHDVQIENNYFGYSVSAVHLEGSSSNHISGFVITNNEFVGYTKYALRSKYANDIIFNKNKLESSIQGSQVYGIYAYRNEGLTIKENHVVVGSTNTVYAFSLSYVNGTASQHSLIANNFISVVSGVSYTYGINLSDCNYIDLIYNSINIVEGNSMSKAIFLSKGSHMDIKNNAIATKTGYALYSQTLPSNIAADYNNYYVDTLASNNFVRWSSNQADIAALKAFDPANNQHSISDNPEYYSTIDLHSLQVSMYNKATPYPGITIDIDNEVRSTTTPSIGADEFTPPAIDLSIDKMLYPVDSDCGYSSNDSIVIRIKNHGLNDLNFANTNATIKVIVSGASTDTITYVINSGVLNSGHDTTLVVSNNYDLSKNGLFTFQAKVIIANDGNSGNDDLLPVSIISYPNINNFPFNEDFESGQNIAFKLYDQTYSSVDVSSSAANNSNYGMHFQGGVYSGGWSHQSTVEGAFLNNSGHIASAVTCNVDASNVTALSLQFDLRQTRWLSTDTNTSWFRVLLIDANNIVHYLKTIQGDSVFKPQTNNVDPFQNYTFNLNSYVGQNFEIRFEALNKTAYGYGAYEGDNAFLDNIILWTPYPNDVGVKKVVSNALHGKVGDNFIVKSAFMNMGSDTLYTIPLAYQVNGGVIVRDTVTGVFLPSVTDTFTFSTPYIIAAKVQNLCVFSELPNDSDPSNDTTCIDIMGMTVFPVDYMDDFESANDWFAYGGLNQWQKGTPTTTNINSAHSGQNAWVTMLSSNYQSGKEEFLYTPYFSIPSYASTATLEFYMFMDFVVPSAYGQMEFSFDGVNWAPYGYIGSTNSINWYNQNIGGMHVWSQQNTGWTYTSIELDSTIFNNNQTFQLRFKFTSGQSTTTADGWAIDDFKITIPSFAKDAGISKILSPINSTVTGDSVVVEVEVKNFGTDTLTTFPVTYAIDGTIVGTETWTGSLTHSEVDTLTFTTKYLGAGVDYDLCVYTSMPMDMQLHNDTVCASISSTPGKIDAGVSAVIAPAGQSTIGKPTTVKIMIRNFGTDTLKNIPVEYLMNGGSKANEIYNGSIAPSDSAEYTFTTTYVSGVGVYSICGLTNMPNDVDATNDQTCVTVVGTAIDMAKGNVFAVAQNQPNPVNGQTSIEFFIPKSGKVQLKIVNTLGEVIENQESDYQTGSHKIVLNTQSYQAGVYYYSLTFEGAVKTFKMIVVR